MLVYVLRRLVVSCLLLFVSTALIFWFLAVSGNPLADLYLDQSAGRNQRIAERIALLHLDEPIAHRYLRWLEGVSRCVIPRQSCDLGANKNGQDVTSLLVHAAGQSLRLMLVAAVLAMVLGITVGIVSAVRQYSAFDYVVTFLAFLFFSLPSFWVAVLLKQYLAIEFNDWLADPVISPPTMAVLSAVAGLALSSILGGDRRRRLRTGVSSAAVVLGLLVYVSAVRWFAYPGLGPVVVLLLGLGTAVGVSGLIGFRHRGALRAALAAAALGGIVQFPLAPLLEDPAWPLVVLLGLGAAAASLGVGYLLGADDRPRACRAALSAGMATASLVFLDHALSSVHDYTRTVTPRMIATIGSTTPELTGDFWTRLIDQAGRLLLPPIAIMLVSFAGYSRFTRAVMLGVLNQDYIRTARATGLPERAVILRHALRNVMIPLTTLIALDLGGILSGVVIAENVFGWDGMGTLFVTALSAQDPAPVMGFFLVTATSLMLFNLLADCAYASLDPRVRLT
jgi:peptide/nickel transport system permease protein